MAEPRLQVTFTRQQLDYLQRKFKGYVVDIAPGVAQDELMFGGGVQRVLKEVEALVQEPTRREIGG